MRSERLIQSGGKAIPPAEGQLLLSQQLLYPGLRVQPGSGARGNEYERVFLPPSSWLPSAWTV